MKYKLQIFGANLLIIPLLIDNFVTLEKILRSIYSLKQYHLYLWHSMLWKLLHIPVHCTAQKSRHLLQLLYNYINSITNTLQLFCSYINLCFWFRYSQCLVIIERGLSLSYSPNVGHCVLSLVFIAPDGLSLNVLNDFVVWPQ